MTITRRDFLNGTALVIGGASTCLFSGCQKQTTTKPIANNASQPSSTPVATESPKVPLVMGGNKSENIGVAHQMGWTNKRFDVSQLPSEAHYDLVVVGAGISGLASAYFYQLRFPNSKILIIDNNDDFGGHAQRNEFNAVVDGKPIFRLSYGGSESIDSPKTGYSKQALNLLEALGIDYTKFEKYYDQQFFDKLNMKRGVFFNKKRFGTTKVINQEPDAKNAKEFFAQAPLSEADKTALTQLYQQPTDYLASLSKKEKTSYLKSTSYADFLRKNAKLSASSMAYLQDICLEYWGFPIEYLSAWDALNEGYAGFDGLGIKVEESESEPYIYHFPDGNASIARLLVKKMIPNVVSNPQHSTNMSAMEAIVLDKFDYTQLDKPNQNVNIRLKATVVQTINTDDHQVSIGYRYNQDETLHRITAKHAILACYSVMIPYITSGLSQQRINDFKQNVKIPLISGKVLVKNWHAFQKLGVWHLYAPNSPFCLVMLDYPVSMGGYEYPKNPDEPVIVHMVQIPVHAKDGSDLRQACRSGRSTLNAMTYAELETQMLDQLTEIYEQAGETLMDKVLAVTVNRWGHGYSHENNILWDKPADAERILASVKKPQGNIHIANSDADWQPYANGAIDQAWRAVNEIGKIG